MFTIWATAGAAAATGTPATSWITVGGLAVTTIGALGASLFAWLRDQGKMQHEARVVALEMKITLLTQSETQLREREQRLQGDIAKMHEREQQLKTEITNLHQIIQRQGHGD